MENEKLDNLKIGKEIPKLEAKSCRVLHYKFEKIEFDKGSNIKLVLTLEHPEGVEIEVSSVKYMKSKDKVDKAGLWVTKDKDENIPFNSALANLLRHYKVEDIQSLVGKDVMTIEDEGYLIIKAY